MARASAISGGVPSSVMNSSDETVDPELRQLRLARFGRVLAAISLAFVGLLVFTTIRVGRASFLFGILPLAVAAAAFGALWLLLRGAPRSSRFIRVVELATLFIGTGAFSSLAVVMDLTASPDMVARTTVSYVLLVYAVYVPSTARRTLLLASLMTVPLLVSIFIAFSAWDPALYDPPAATSG
jgi:hypothetical protein